MTEETQTTLTGRTAMGRHAGDNHAINVVRALAALLVAISHVRTMFFADYSNVSHSPLLGFVYAVCSLGHGAVIVFFVLSGFWVGGSVIRQVKGSRFSWESYAIRRLTRLWLVLVPAVLLTWVVDRMGIWFFERSSVYRGAASYHNVVPATHHLGLVIALGNVGFLQTIRVPAFGTDTPLWSLAYEFWFYAWLPMLLIGLASRRLWIASAYAAVFAASIWLVGFTVLAYFPLWLLGAAIGWRAQDIRHYVSSLAPSRYRLLVAVAAGATFTSLLVDKGLALPDRTGAPAIGVATAVLLAVLTRDLHPKQRVLQLTLDGASRYAGVSYSLYAIHLPIVALLAAAITGGAQWQPTASAAVKGIGIVLLVLAAAWVFGRSTEGQTDRVRVRVASVLRLVGGT